MTGIVYAIFGVACITILSPLFALALIFAPGMILQAFMLLSHFTFEYVSHQYPGLFNKLFLSNLKTTHPRDYERVAEGLARNPDHSSLLGWVEQSAFRWWHFAKTSTLLSVVGFVPLLGPIVSTLGQVRLPDEW